MGYYCIRGKNHKQLCNAIKQPILINMHCICVFLRSIKLFEDEMICRLECNSCVLSVTFTEIVWMFNAIVKKLLGRQESSWRETHGRGCCYLWSGNSRSQFPPPILRLWTINQNLPSKRKKTGEFASPIPPPPYKFLLTGLDWLFIKQYATCHTAVTLIDRMTTFIKAKLKKSDD